MIFLTKNELSDIENQMFNKARDIDVALFNYITGTMSNEFVGYALTMYQNRDGGFGHGLDNDNLNPNSTVYQTLVGLRYISYASLDLSNEDISTMIKRMFNYLYNKNPKWTTYDEANKKFACASRFANEVLAYDLTPEILGYTISLLDSKSPYYRKALQMLDVVDRNLLQRESLSFEELVGYKALFRALENKSIDANQEAYYYFIKLRNNYISSLKVNECNYNEVLELLDDKFEFEDKIEESFKAMKAALKPHGLWESTTTWDNDYPEAESAGLKWLGTKTVMNILLLNKFQGIEE